MKKHTYEELIDSGYRVENAQIKSVDLSMADHGCLTLALDLEGKGWGVTYGGYVLAKGYVGADDDSFSGSAKGMESIVRIMDVVGCDRFNDMKHEYIRVALKGYGATPVRIIGNIIKDKWFDIEDFFKEFNE